MSMLNQAAVEALCSATYLENYLDCMENLPDDLQRCVSALRELDSATCDLLRDISHHQEVYLGDPEPGLKKRALIQIQRALIKTQEIGDEKLQIVAQINEIVENRTRQLEQDLENLDPGSTIPKEPEDEPLPKPVPTPKIIKEKPEKIEKEKPEEPKPEKVASKRQRRQRTETIKEEEKKEEKEKPKKKKKRKAKKEETREKSPVPEPIDPDEPTYCLCDQISYGEMIGCDYDECAIEWFHFNCVGLTNKPKGKWYCPNCRGDKPTVKRPDLK